MKTLLLYISLFFCTAQILFSQEENGVVTLDIPVRNSLTFNRFLVQPTFSFVREQNKYLTGTNKRELLEIEDAPQTYILNYSGRFRENIGAGIALFQKNNGVLTTFGGVLNAAYNVRFDEESNLTFGVNIGAYQSGLNMGSVITNFDDPILNTIPSNFLITINPGINYGSGYLDFGVSLSNMVTYNFNTSQMINENPDQGFQGHLMYTGYTGGFGFFRESKFTALGRAEILQDNTIFSGVAMLTVPKGIWTQVGYNTLYGASAGLGINITSQIAIEYNYEQPFGEFSDLGSAHEITLAYRFKNDNYYDYSRDEELAGLFDFENKPKKKSKKKNTAIVKTEEAASPNPNEEEIKIALEEKAQQDLEEEEQRIAQEATKLAVEEQDRIAQEQATKLAVEEQERIAQEGATKLAVEKQERIAQEEATKLAVEEQDRIAQEATKRTLEEQERIAQEEATKLAVEEQERIAQEEATKLAAEEQERIAQEQATKLAAEEQERIAQEQATKLAVEEQERIAQEQATKLAVEEQSQIAKISEEKTIEEAIQKARVAKEEAKLEYEEQARLEKALSIKNPQDNIGIAISKLSEETIEESDLQTTIVNQLQEAVAIKEKDLADLMKENDLSEQGISVAPKPFKSFSAENEKIENLKITLDTILLRQSKKISELESLLKSRKRAVRDNKDETNLYYQNTLEGLKTRQKASRQLKSTLVSSLESIKIATEIQRKRRIKRAAFDNEQDRFEKDRTALNILKQNTDYDQTVLVENDFDFGIPRSNNIEILKNVQNTTDGFYLVLAVHSNARDRDIFLEKIIASGYRDVDFFYNVNTTKYYIYYKKYDTLEEVTNASQSINNKPYLDKSSVIKIEN